MKKFLSVLLAVMMVLSTVSFAAPSAFVAIDSALEAPVVEEVATEADLSADSEWANPAFGTLVAEVNFDRLTASSDLAELKGRATNNTSVVALGGKVNPAFEAGLGNVFFFDTSGANQYTNMEVVQDAKLGTYFKATITNNNKTAFDFRTADPNQFVSEDGYLAVTLDVKASKDNMLSFRYNRSHNAEDSIKDATKETKTKANEWVTVVSRYDASSIGKSTHKPPIAGTQEINHILFYTQSAVIGDTIEMDNWRVYYYPKTVSYTVDLSAYGKDDVVFSNVDTMTRKSVDELAALLPEVEGLKFIGFSATEGGEAFGTDVYVDGATVYPVYEERVALPGSLEFTTEDEFKKVSFRQSNSCVPNNALGTANTLSHDATNGYLKATFQATDTTKSVQDTGINLSGISIPAGSLTNIEIKFRFTGMPTTSTVINQFTGGTSTYNPAKVNFPQYYFTTGGKFSTKGEKLYNDLSDANGNWKVINYTAEELGITDLTTFRFDFCDHMPHGSTLELDYIRFIGRPSRVTVDNGDNKSAPAVKMDLKKTTTVAEVEAMYAKDHGDMIFVGLSRTPGGAVLADSELVSPDGTSTTLYAIWDDYEYLTYYSVEFNNQAEEAKKVRINQNNNNGTTVEWNEEGYISLTSAPKNGTEASWDHQIFVETFNLENPLPAGVVSKIAVRARYRNVPTETKVYTVDGKESYKDEQRTLNPANAPYYVYVTDATASKWAEEGHLSIIGTRTKIVEGEWFTYYVDADKFANGMSFARFDSTYPMPEGMVWDVDYIRFLGDNQDERLPIAKYLGQYGEKVFEVDFDDAATGAAPKAGSKIDAYGAEVNSFLCTASNGITFTHGASGGYTVPTVTIAEKNSADKYLTYTLNADSTNSYFFFSAGQKELVGKDGYFIATFDIKCDEGVPMTFRMNKHDLVQDTAEHIQIIENGEWDKAILYYDAELGSGTHSSGNVVTSLKDISVVKWHPTSKSKAGQTVAIDNFTLWYVPKTVKATIDLSEQGLDNVVIKDYPTDGLSRGELELALPKVADYEVTGLALTQGGEALYQNRIASEATLYPIYEKVNILPYTVEFNSESELAALKALSGNAFRKGKNSALEIADQYIIETENGRSFLRMRNQALNAEAGAVVDYGFWVANPIDPSEIKEIVINMRVPEWAASGKYTRETGAQVNFNPQSMVFQFYFMDATGAKVKKEINPIVNAVTENGSWFTITIDGSQIPSDAVLFRIDPPDFIGHGTTIDIDYVRFYGFGYTAPEVLEDETGARFSDDEYGNGVRFKSTVGASTEEFASDIGWVITTANYWTEDYSALTVESKDVPGAKVKVAYQRLEGADKANFFATTDESKTFAAVLYNIPKANALDYVLVRPFVVVDGEYYYGSTATSRLYDVAVTPYIDWLSEEYEDIDELIDEEVSLEAALEYEDIAFNDDYFALGEDTKQYIYEILETLLG